MDTITDFMLHHHRDCDEAFARAEEAAAAGDWPAAQAAFESFRRAIERHIVMEEEVLFPAFEDETGMSGGGPTHTMRIEHGQMRALFEQMAQAAGARNAAQFLGLAETLLVLMQQHNLKEESMLYPMMDQAFGARAGELIGRVEL